MDTQSRSRKRRIQLWTVLALHPDLQPFATALMPVAAEGTDKVSSLEYAEMARPLSQGVDAFKASMRVRMERNADSDLRGCGISRALAFRSPMGAQTWSSMRAETRSSVGAETWSWVGADIWSSMRAETRSSARAETLSSVGATSSSVLAISSSAGV